MRREWLVGRPAGAAAVLAAGVGLSATLSHVGHAASWPQQRSPSSQSQQVDRTSNPCTSQYEVTGPDGNVLRTTYATVGADGAGKIEFWLHFGPGNLPDPAIAPASHRQPSTQFGDVVVTAVRTDRTDFRAEKAGDPRLVYMREAPVLKLGGTWFVGDRIDFDRKEGLISVGVDADFMDIFQNTRSFEIWWKGVRRMMVRVVPDKVPPEQFSAECLPLPADIREQVRRADSAAVMRKLVPSPVPRPMAFFRGPAAGWNLKFNPFDSEDKGAGTASFEIMVGRDGLVKQCDLVRMRGKVPQRGEACEVLRRWARFYPATDRAGALVEAPLSVALDWSGRS